jgi:hypothetical protein
LFFCGNFLADTQFYHLEHIRACPVIKYTTVKYMEDAKEEVNKKAKKEERLLGLYLKTHFSHQGKIITFLPWKLC